VLAESLEYLPEALLLVLPLMLGLPLMLLPPLLLLEEVSRRECCLFGVTLFGRKLITTK
jgi:hypothetical protein